MVDWAFHSSKVDEMNSRIPGDLVIKRLLVMTLSAALKQLNPIHKNKLFF